MKKEQGKETINDIQRNLEYFCSFQNNTNIAHEKETMETD